MSAYLEGGTPDDLAVRAAIVQLLDDLAPWTPEPEQAEPLPAPAPVDPVEHRQLDGTVVLVHPTPIFDQVPGLPPEPAYPAVPHIGADGRVDWPELARSGGA